MKNFTPFFLTTSLLAAGVSLNADMLFYYNSAVLPTIISQQKAIEDGDASNLSKAYLFEKIDNTMLSVKSGNSLLKGLYNDEVIAYTPSKNSQILLNPLDSPTLFPIIFGNGKNTLALAGDYDKTRISVFASSPTKNFDDGIDESFKPQFNRLLAWLLQDEPINISRLNDSNSIAISFMGSSTTSIKNYLSIVMPNSNITECNDIATLSSCYSGVDLIITGSSSSDSNPDVNKIKSATIESLTNKTPILYLHTSGWSMNTVSDTFSETLGFTLKYAGNYFRKDTASWLNYSQMQNAIYTYLGYDDFEPILEHLKKRDFTLDLSQCDDKGESCEYNALFGDTMKSIHDNIVSLESKNIDIFENNAYPLQKYFVLLGDKYRQEVNFPMDKSTTDTNTFLESLFADYTHYSYRRINPTQKDMGNFSRSDFSHITPITKTVTKVSRKPFRSTGLYALPSKNITITRNDSSDVKVSVFINTLRSGSTHVFEENGYKRPKFLQSAKYTILPNETIVITSAYGGPLQLGFDSNDKNVSLTFSNVGEHAYWASSADDSSFSSKLEANEYDWAEITTSGFEVHSTLSKMKESIANYGSATNLTTLTNKYTYNLPLVLAGLQGSGIDVVAEIHDFAIAKGWNIDNIEQVKHMNADQASCGYGCSGNPYDAYWAFDPLGHGDLHEIGHSLEKSRFRFSGWEGHSTTNPYSYYTKSRYFSDTANDPNCQNLPFEQTFDLLQQSVQESNATAYLQANLWPGKWSNQVLFTIESMMSIERMSKDNTITGVASLENGWHLLAREQILEREFSRAIKDTSVWEAKKVSLGFSSYTLDEAKNISNNDWKLIALSTVAEADFRNYLTIWGIEYSTKANAQVASFSYPSVPTNFYKSSDNGYCKEDSFGLLLDKESSSIDGISLW